MGALDIIVPVITLILGLLLGHKLSLGRDKRKEFNDIATPIYIKLENQLDRANSNLYPVIDASKISQEEITRLKRAISKQKSNKLQETYEHYNSALRDCGYFTEFGDFELKDLKEVKDLIIKLQSFLPHK